MLSFITGLTAIGYHPGSWRHPSSWENPAMNFERTVEMAKTAERGLLDMVFLADSPSLNLKKAVLIASGGGLTRPAIFEPVTLLTAIAMHTKNIGLLATASTTYEEPMTLARKFASLDHLSGGRACWNIVTTGDATAAENFNRGAHPAREDRYGRAREFVEVCKGLWTCWDEDALTFDRESGLYIDPEKIHALNHKGQNFAVRGPMNIPRSPQGHPVLFSAGQSEPGREFAASSADCQFAVTNTKQEAVAYYADVKARMSKYGRAPDDMRIMPGCMVYAGRSRAEAEELLEELQSLIQPALGVSHLGGLMDTDLTGYPIDGPVPEPQDQIGGSSRRYVIHDMAKRDNLNIRQTYERVIASMGHVMMIGSGKDIADQMEDWYKSKACDGFNIHIPHQPGGLTNFVDLVIPELQKRGIFRTEYKGSTLRERMGLPIPPNPHLAVQPAAARIA